VLDDDDFSVSVRIDFAMDDSLGKTYPLAAAGAAWTNRRPAHGNIFHGGPIKGQHIGLFFMVDQ
jgi:hypothetical protein